MRTDMYAFFRYGQQFPEFGFRPRMKRIKERSKRSCILISLFLFQLGAGICQTTTYDTFEGSKVICYGERSGVLDTTAKNPAPDAVNESPNCALYVRNSSRKFDNIKMKLKTNLSDVSAFATYLGEPPKIKMKIYTSAPPGTLVEILLGSKNRNNDYPAGTNSQYQAYTTVSNKWEQLEFKFSQIPQGSETSTQQVDQVTLLFNPNTSTSDTYYFDDITGPELVMEKKDMIATPPGPSQKPDETKKSKTPKRVSATGKITKK